MIGIYIRIACGVQGLLLIGGFRFAVGRQGWVINVITVFLLWVSMSVFLVGMFDLMSGPPGAAKIHTTKDGHA